MTIEDNLVERLLDGSVEADDLPTELVAVASVLRAAAAPPRPDEQVPGPGAISEIFEQARRPPAAPGPQGRGRRSTRRWAVPAAVAAAIAGFSVSGGVALAATGSLPDPAQSAAHELLAVVGVDVPDAPATSPEPADQPDATGGPASTTSVPPTPTTTSIGEPPTVTAPTTDVTGVPGLGDEVCEEASDGRCQAGEHGRAGDDHPSVTRPPVTDPSPTTPVDPPDVPENPSATRPDNPSVTRPENPSATRPENPSATAPGQTKGQDTEPTQERGRGAEQIAP